jgi:ketosteroid isomerase-like protein
MRYILTSCLLFLVFIPCPAQNDGTNTIKQQLQRLSELRIQAEKNDDLKSFLQYYDDSIISMPEYQLTLTGIAEVEVFYREIFKRQKIQLLQRKVTEVIVLGRTVVEIGTFKKEYPESKAGDTLQTQNGKYWNIWTMRPDGSFKLKGEAFGFFHPVPHPEYLIVPMGTIQPGEQELPGTKEIPFELKAYNALMEKGVRSRNAVLRARFYTNDGSFMPFADTTVTGMNEIKPWMAKYSSSGNATIDSINCYTYHYEYFDRYILEYDMFKIKWSGPGYSGRAEGKGIRIWKRQEDKSLKLFREIGTHNHIQ